MNSENNLIRKIFSIGIAYLVALAGIELYVYKIEGNPVYSGKITSNIIPYAVFLLVYCLLVCIIMNIPAQCYISSYYISCIRHTYRLLS